MLWLLAAMGKAEGCVARGEWRGHATALSVAPAFRRLGWAAKSMERLEEISEKEKRPERTPARTDLSTGDSFSSSPAVGRRDWDIRKKGGLVDAKHRIGIYVLKEKKGKPRCIEWENSEEDIQLLVAPPKQPKSDSSSGNGVVRNNREEIEEKEKRGRVTLQAALLAALREDQEKGRENTGAFRRLGWAAKSMERLEEISEKEKRPERTPARTDLSTGDSFSSSPAVGRRDWDIRKKGGLVDAKHRIGIYVLKEKKGKPRCIEWENSEEDIQLLVAPPKQPKSDSSSGNGVVRNNREEIEEKEKRGRVTLQAALLAALREDQEKGRENTGAFRRLGWAAKSMERLEEISEKEKRPERTPARTDLSTGDSFSSSPAVGRRDWDIRKKGGLVDAKHRIGIYVLKEKKGKPCCIEWENSEEDIQLLVAPPKQPKSDSSSGNGVVRNNREEIEEKEKRGRVTLQAALLAALREDQEKGRENTGAFRRLGWAAKSMERLEEISEKEKRPERTPARTDLSTGDSFSSSPAVGRRDWDIRKKGGLVDAKHRIGIYVLKEKKGKPRCIEWENSEEDIQLLVAPPKQPKSDSSSGNGVVRNNREEIEEKEKRGRVTLQAALLAALREDQEKGRENTGAFRRLGWAAKSMERLEEISEKEKRPERTPARTDLSTGDSFSSSPAVGRRDWDIRKKGGLVDAKHRIGIYVLKEKKGKPRCIEWENSEEDIQLLVAPPKQPKSDSSSGNGVVRNNREEIEEKEKRGRVTLQAALLAALREDQEKGRENTGAFRRLGWAAKSMERLEEISEKEKRPERTPARTDLSTGDSFSSSPAVGRRDWDIRKKGGLVDAKHRIGIYVLKEKKGKPRCIEWENSEEDIQLLVAPPKQPKSDSSSGNGVVRNNREEIEEKEKRGRVTLQAALLAALREDQEKGRENTGAFRRLGWAAKSMERLEEISEKEKRPERTPARTDLSTGDSFSSSPAVGRRDWDIRKKGGLVDAKHRIGIYVLKEKKGKPRCIEWENSEEDIQLLVAPPKQPKSDSSSGNGVVRNNREEIEEKEKRGRVTLQAALLAALREDQEKGRENTGAFRRLGWAAKSMERLEEISEKEKRPERTPARTDLSTGDSFSSSPAVGRRDWDIRKKGGLVDAKHRIGIYVLKEKKGKPRCIEWENSEEDIQLLVAPPKQPKSDSSSGNGVVRNNREEIEEKEKRGRVTLQAALLAALREDQEKGRENTGAFRRLGWAAKSMERLEEISEKEKRPERTPARTDLSTGDSFSSSPAVGRRDWDIRKKGGLVDAKHRIGIYVLKEKKGKPRCIEWENSEEDIQLLVAPPKQPKSDSSSGNGVVRNNREEIEEKEKRGRVTLQAALLAALREDQEKGRENTGAFRRLGWAAKSMERLEEISEKEKRPERTPARTDLSTGDSFSSSPAVGRRDWDIRKKGGLVDAKHRIGIYVLKEKKGKPRCIEWENSEEDIQLLVAPPKQPKSDSSSGNGVVRNNREEIEEKEKRGRVTLQAALLAALREDQEKGRENTGAFRRLGWAAKSMERLEEISEKEKRPERTPARTDLSTGDSFSSSPAVGRRDWDIRKKGGLVDAKHRIGIYVLKEKKGKPRCIEWENSEEDIQLLVAPPKQPKSDSSSGNGVVRNNREEIEEKEKRGRVTLQAALLAALREDQEKGRENTGAFRRLGWAAKSMERLEEISENFDTPGGTELTASPVRLAASDREKRPERTPARTDLSTGDSFSSSPAVGR
ncbi:hypothetical protein QYF61_018227 [Mycteria americana]|uniref:Uncharacterized protein n=1 Tax=Mycteria americana TaxID=33587 RepID=A0AAN7RP19_MYCAM|nr:hypothetical protein QYF61_018227 [Mycteria americana]